MMAFSRANLCFSYADLMGLLANLFLWLEGSELNTLALTQRWICASTLRPVQRLLRRPRHNFSSKFKGLAAFFAGGVNPVIV